MMLTESWARISIVRWKFHVFWILPVTPACFAVSNPANTKHLYIICTTTAQRLWRWSNILQMLYQMFCVCWEETVLRENDGNLWLTTRAGLWEDEMLPCDKRRVIVYHTDKVSRKIPLYCTVRTCSRPDHFEDDVRARYKQIAYGPRWAKI